MSYQVRWADGREPTRCDNLTGVVCAVSGERRDYVSQRKEGEIHYWASLEDHADGHAPFAMAVVDRRE